MPRYQRAVSRTVPWQRAAAPGWSPRTSSGARLHPPVPRYLRTSGARGRRIGPARLPCVALNGSREWRGLTAAWLHGVWRPSLRNTRAPTCRSVRALAAQARATPWRRISSRRAGCSSRHRSDVLRPHAAFRLVEAVVVADAFRPRSRQPAPCSRLLRGPRRWPEVRHAGWLCPRPPRGALPGETRLRMVVVLAGFEEPLVNVPVDADGRPPRHTRPPVPRTHLGLSSSTTARTTRAPPSRPRTCGARTRSSKRRAGVPVLRYDRPHCCVQRSACSRGGPAPAHATPGARHRDFSRPTRLRW